jgi:hypothetical protein
MSRSGRCARPPPVTVVSSHQDRRIDPEQPDALVTTADLVAVSNGAAVDHGYGIAGLAGGAAQSWSTPADRMAMTKAHSVYSWDSAPPLVLGLIQAPAAGLAKS